MQLMRGSVDDSPVRLVGNEPIDGVGAGAGSFERGHDHVGDHSDRVLEHFATFHSQISYGLSRRRTAIYEQFRFVPAVRAQMGGQDTPVREIAGLRLSI